MNLNINPQPSGVLLIDKPEGISSFDIIRALRRQTGVRKIGHAGTLDPMATGLMIMLVGTATKQAQHFSGLDKVYVAHLTFGAVSSTGDREGELTTVSDRQPTAAELADACRQQTGSIQQVPSAYSAIKINGVRAYKLARQGKEVIMPARTVTVHRLMVHSYDYPVVKFEADVSSGTYVRSLAADIGAQLKVGAYLSQLRRVSIGDYKVSQAHQLSNITAETLADSLLN